MFHQNALSEKLFRLVMYSLHHLRCLLGFFPLGGKDAVSSGFGYFMSAAVVLTLCLITYMMLNRLVRRLEC